MNQTNTDDHAALLHEVPFKCCVCGEPPAKIDDVKEKHRLKPNAKPRGWKTFNGENWCPACWTRSHYTRMVTLPIVRPLNLEWKEFRELMKHQFRISTIASNALVQELFRNDVSRTPQMEKLPPYSARVDGYNFVRKMFPEMFSQTASTLAQMVARKYMQERWFVLWRFENHLLTFKYPQPIVLPGKDNRFKVQPAQDGGSIPVVSVNIGGKRIELQLQSGTRKHGNWMKDQLNKIAKQVVLYAQSHKVTELQYDDLDHSFIESFPWHELKTLIAQKCPEVGIGFVDLTPLDSKREAAQNLVPA